VGEEKSRDELFRELEAKNLIKSTGVVPADVTYSPPQGRILGQTAQELLSYEPTAPTPQTDLLQNCERQFVLPMVMPLALIFKVPPITDDIYRFATEDMKDSSLFCIISRSNIRKSEQGFIVWDPFVTVIKRKIVVFVTCAYHPMQKQFRVLALNLWQNSTSSYFRVTDERLGLVLPGLVDRYVKLEGIFRQTGT